MNAVWVALATSTAPVLAAGLLAQLRARARHVRTADELTAIRAELAELRDQVDRWTHLP